MHASEVGVAGQSQHTALTKAGLKQLRAANTGLWSYRLLDYREHRHEHVIKRVLDR
jgi:hypothetical protein